MSTDGKQITTTQGMGPAMAALGSDRQRAFVEALAELPPGKGLATRAARMAGYAGEADVLKVTASRLMRDPKIQDAIVEETKRRLRTLGPAAVSAIEGVLANSLHRDHYRAAVEVYDRIDPKVTKVEGSIHHTHEIVNHDKEAVEQLQTLQSLKVPEEKLVELFGLNGLERYRRLLATKDAQIVDAEFTEVVPDTERASADPDDTLLFGDKQ